ncbi:hypothetical protein BD414DRAFT_527055 [Trametes punicea]|nr:hypothetical protein BD414DRAFT_527055 [Trametes punicea]
MRRRSSKTFQRIRKLSDSIVNAIVPTGTSKNAEPSTRLRRISTDDISRPRLHPEYSLESWLTKEESDSNPRKKPARPSVDVRPPVLHDQMVRGREREVFRTGNKPKRPERPREEDLPYGAKGSVPILTAPWLRPELAVRPSMSKTNSVPFPSNLTSRPVKESPPPREFFSPFATVGRHASTRDANTLKERADGRRASPSAQRVEASLPAGQTREEAVCPQNAPQRPAERGHAREDVSHRPAGPATVRRQGAIRRPSRTSDASPPQHLRNQFGGSDHTLREAPTRPDLGLQRSRSMATPQAPRSSSSASAFSPRANTVDEAKTRPKRHDISRDIAPRSAQHSPFLSGESGSAEAEEPMLIPPAPVATQRMVAKAQANMPLQYSPAPRAVKLSTPDSKRVASFTAQIVEPPPEAKSSKAAKGLVTEPAKKDREREHGRSHVRQKTTRTVEHYPMTYYFEEVKRGFGGAVPSESVGTEDGALGHDIEPLRPRKVDREKVPRR